MKRARQKDPEHHRSIQLKSKYGITVEQYNELLINQEHACAVCHRPASQFAKRLAVDHNHVTGEIRGLLCTNCNRNIIGRHKTGEILRSAADYLDRPHTGWFVPKKKKKNGRKRKTNG